MRTLRALPLFLAAVAVGCGTGPTMPPLKTPDKAATAPATEKTPDNPATAQAAEKTPDKPATRIRPCFGSHGPVKQRTTRSAQGSARDYIQIQAYLD